MQDFEGRDFLYYVFLFLQLDKRINYTCAELAEGPVLIPLFYEDIPYIVAPPPPF